MRVRELIELLSDQDQDALVVVSSDEEGNGFGEVVDWSLSAYDQAEGETGLMPDQLTDEMRERGFCEDDVMEGPDVVLAVVLWP